MKSRGSFRSGRQSRIRRARGGFRKLSRFRAPRVEALEERRLLAIGAALDLDFGDAPDVPYATVLASDGPRHEATGPMLGGNRDAETDGQPTAAANGDDTTGTPNDEDGVTFGSAIMVGQLDASVTVNVQNAPSGAKLDAWIDFNGDGSWGGPSEQIADGLAVSEGNNTIQFDVPSHAAEGGTFARFRLSTAGDLAPTGAAVDGEVEDYSVTIEPPASASGNFVTHQEIAEGRDGVRSISSADMDGDGDMDVLVAYSRDDEITWYENDGNQSFTAHIISSTANDPRSVLAADVDGDGDMDVVAANAADDEIAWYENDGSESFTAHTITDAAEESVSVFVADVDGDGDIDVLSASSYDDKIAWYENDGNENFTAHTITASAEVPSAVFASDVDGDGDMDVAWASWGDDKIAWHENDGSENFTAHTVTASANTPVAVFVSDVDDDGDMDMLSANWGDDKIVWYENDGNESFTAHTITDAAAYPHSVFAADVDGDGDVDVLSASSYDDKVAWYENDGSENFTAHTITTSANEAQSVFVADVDGDGDLDVLSGAMQGNGVAWYENSNVISIGSLSDGPDPVTQPSNLTLTANGVAVSEGTVNKVEFYRDSNGNGSLDVGTDQLLGSDVSSSGGWTWTGATGGFPTGSNRYFARAEHDGGAWSNVVTTTGTVNPPANQAPTIASLSDTPDPVTQPANVTLTANSVSDADGTVSQVEFYRDSNGNGALNVGTDQLLGTDASATGGWTWTGATGGFPAGTNRYFARARDDDGAYSTVATTTGTVAQQGKQIIDNGSPGFSAAGPWTPFAGLGYENDIHYAAKGSGSAQATWTFAVTPGVYEVAATWHAHANRATDAPYTVFSGSTALGTVDVNQEVAPNDFSDEGVPWETLGTYTITGSELRVQLTDAANEFVIADAIRIVKVGDPGPNTKPNTPSGTSPANGASDVSLTPALTSSGFSDPDAGDSHKATRWQVATDSAFGSLVWNYTDTDSNKISEAVASGELSPSTEYYWRMQHQDSRDAWSDWGTGRSFTTAAASVEPQIIDNGDAGFSTVGAWTPFAGQGHAGDVHFAAKGSGSAKATWAFTVTPGTYQVAATWVAHANRASDAPYTVLDGSTPLGTVDVNQESAPNDFSDAGSNWEELGTFTVTGSNLTVQLSNQANEFVIADAVRIERVGDPSPTITVSSPNGGESLQPGGTQTISWSSIADPGANVMIDLYKGGSLDHAIVASTPNDGSYSWAIPAGQTVGTDYQIKVTSTSNASYSDLSNGNFAIGQVVVHEPRIMDNGDSGFSTAGPWTPFVGQGHANDVHFVAKGSGSAQATWTFTVEPGTYDVAATWTAHANRATDAPYTVFDGSTPLGTVDVNQESAPNDFSDAGSNWEDLGTFTVTGSTLRVQLTDGANEFVIADAVRIQRVGAASPTLTMSNPNGGESWQPGETETITWSSAGDPGANVMIDLYKGGSLDHTITASTANDGSYSWSIPSDQAAGADYKIKVTSTSASYSDLSNSDFSIGQAVYEPEFLDNGSAGFSVVGQWFPFTGQGFGNDVHFAQKGSGSAKATWTFTVAPGNYQVAATWTGHANRATDAPYTVFDNSTPLETVDVNQESAPSDFSDEGVNWENLGTFTITGNTLTVQLSNAANEFVIADAIRVRRV